MKQYFILLMFLVFGQYTISFAQVIDNTGFESYADETEYTLSSWQSDGFTVPWVNGFNQSRAYVDDAFAKFGTKSLRIKYPANQFGPANSGAQAPLTVTPANELYMSYWIRFSDNFDWGGTSEGGKLPGLGGGGRCSGCTVCTGANGFTARLMWRAGGKAVLYLYHMEADKANGPCGDNDVLQVTSGVDFYFQKGQWYNVVQRVKVNSGTNHDGEVQLWIDGQQALLRTGIQFVSNGDKVDNLYFSTFHGGSTSAWSPSVDCYTWFDDMKIASTLGDVLPASNQPPTVSILTPVNNTEKCVGESLTLTTNAFDSDGSIAKVEFYNGTALLGTVTSSSFNYTINSLSLGTYSLTAKAYDNLNATTTSTVITLTVNASPVATISTTTPTSFCTGGSVLLTASAGSSYMWFRGATQLGTGQTYSATAAGNYTVEVTDGNNCSATSVATTVAVSSALTWYQDLDGDGKGDAGVTQTSCTQPTGYVSVSGDACPNDADKLTPGLCGCGTAEGTCQTTGVVDLKSTEAIKIMPNPSSDQFSLILAESAVVYISTVEGKQVDVFQNVTDIKFGSDYTKGVYVVQIMNGSNAQIIRVIKQ